MWRESTVQPENNKEDNENKKINKKWNLPNTWNRTPHSKLTVGKIDSCFPQLPRHYTPDTSPNMRWSYPTSTSSEWASVASLLKHGNLHLHLQYTALTISILPFLPFQIGISQKSHGSTSGSDLGDFWSPTSTTSTLDLLLLQNSGTEKEVNIFFFFGMDLLTTDPTAETLDSWMAHPCGGRRPRPRSSRCSPWTRCRPRHGAASWIAVK